MRRVALNLAAVVPLMALAAGIWGWPWLAARWQPRPEAEIFETPGARGEPGAELVVFVLVDALRRDHLSAYGYERPTSPTFDRLAREGLWLRHLTTHAPHTVPSTLSLWTARLPSEHGLQFDPESRSFDAEGAARIPRVAESLVTMAEIFAGAGYFTAGVVANPWLRHAYGFAQGFDHYTELASRDGLVIGERGRALVRAHAGEKTFLYLHYMDVHNPYKGAARGAPPFERPARGRLRYRNGPMPDLSDEDLRYTETLYDERIYYMDGHLAEWLDFFRAEAADRKITLVLTSDHGDEFGEHGGLGHGTSLWGEQINGFAVLWGTGITRREIASCTAAVDVLPTLLDAQRIPAPPGLGGQSQWGGGPDAVSCARAIVSELGNRKALLHGGWKLVRELDAGTDALYAVGVESRIEEHPVDDPQTRQDLGRRLDAALATRGSPEAEWIPLDAETRKRLEDLGYLE